MKILFEKLVEVQLHHNYYDSNVSRDFDIAPSGECNRLMRDYGLRFKKTANGFAIYYEAQKRENDTSHPVYPIDESAKFSFFLRPASPYLLNYTELPFEGHSGSVYCFHNLNDNQQNSDLLLSKNSSSEFISTEDRVSAKPMSFQHSFAAGATAQIVIYDDLGKIIKQETVSPNEGQVNYFVDLNRHKAGRYFMKVNGQNQFEFYASSELYRLKAFGVVDLFVDPQVPSVYRFIKDNFDTDFKSYRVNIDSRKTNWKYLVHLKQRKDTQASELTIQSSNTFTAGAEFTTTDGIRVVPFVSDRTIALKEQPYKDIKLVKNGSASDSFEVKNLANASVTNIELDDITKKVYSKIFVYI